MEGRRLGVTQGLSGQIIGNGHSSYAEVVVSAQQRDAERSARYPLEWSKDEGSLSPDKDRIVHDEGSIFRFGDTKVHKSVCGGEIRTQPTPGYVYQTYQTCGWSNSRCEVVRKCSSPENGGNQNCGSEIATLAFQRVGELE